MVPRQTPPLLYEWARRFLVWEEVCRAEASPQVSSQVVSLGLLPVGRGATACVWSPGMHAGLASSPAVLVNASVYGAEFSSPMKLLGDLNPFQELSSVRRLVKEGFRVLLGWCCYWLIPVGRSGGFGAALPLHRSCEQGMLWRQHLNPGLFGDQHCLFSV